MKKHRMIYIQSEDTDIYVSQKFIMQREPNKWVLRSLPDYDIIGSDRYRNDLACQFSLDLYAHEVDLYSVDEE